MKAVKYLKSVSQELKKVTWPTKEATTKMTIVVIVASLIVGLYIGGLDFLFTNLLSTLFK